MGSRVDLHGVASGASLEPPQSVHIRVIKIRAPAFFSNSKSACESTAELPAETLKTKNNAVQTNRHEMEHLHHFEKKKTPKTQNSKTVQTSLPSEIADSHPWDSHPVFLGFLWWNSSSPGSATPSSAWAPRSGSRASGRHARRLGERKPFRKCLKSREWIFLLGWLV